MTKKSEGGWSGIGMANSGIDPTHVFLLNDHPTQIPPSEILGPVVQNCHFGPIWTTFGRFCAVFGNYTANKLLGMVTALQI